MDGPSTRHHRRKESFSGFLGITGQRLVGYTCRKRQLNISLDGPRPAKLHVDVPGEDRLSISLESADFREDWKGLVEFRFNPDQARSIGDALVSRGARYGVAANE